MTGEPGGHPSSSWQGSPCPACGASLAQRGAPARASEAHFLVILTCGAGHCWEGSICARTLYSSVLVHRRIDLEGFGGERGPAGPRPRV